MSEFLPVNVGVPQGSILGPLIFLAFFNDLPFHTVSPVDSYADDTTVTATGRSLEELKVKLTEDCKNVSNWMKANKLKMNAEKTHILVMSTQRRLSSLDRQLEIKIDGQVLKSTKCEKLLGCTVSCNLKWN